MMLERKGFRWWLFNRLGPPRVKQILDILERIANQTGDVIVYPKGEFNVQTTIYPLTEDSEGQKLLFEFYTDQERQAFITGLNCGAQSAGGSILDSEDSMDKQSTHSSSKRIN